MMITDPLPDDRPKPRPARGFPVEAPPHFAMREGLSPIVAFVERVQQLAQKARRSIEQRLHGPAGPMR
jgi:hypothetical protein